MKVFLTVFPNNTFNRKGGKVCVYLLFRGRSGNKLQHLIGSLLVQKEKDRHIDVKNDSQPLANLRYVVFDYRAAKRTIAGVLGHA